MTTAAHAKYRPPSSAKRWLSCPVSAVVVALYDNPDTEQSLKGDYYHRVMEDTVVFNMIPPTIEPDLQEAMEDLLAYVHRRIEEMGGRGKVQVYVETRLAIPETGEFGTADIILVGPTEIEVIDLKSGYVPVDVRMNPQMLTYLCGVVAIYGHRRKYKLTIHQPGYDHIDGVIRSFDANDDDLNWFRGEIKYSMDNPDVYAAGKHCKETYCDHRGACATFAEYTKNDLALGWHTSEINAVSDEDLAKALDASDELGGYRGEIRTEAMKRIINMDRKIAGYKVVKGRKQRSVTDALKVVLSVRDTLGAEWATKLFAGFEWAASDLANALARDTLPDALLSALGTAKQIEDVIKKYAQVHKLPRGGWKGVYDNVVGPYIRETHSGLTLEKAIDGRPAHKRGSEFSPLSSPGEVSII